MIRARPRGWPEPATYEEYCEQVWADDYEDYWFAQFGRMLAGKRESRPMGWPQWKAERAEPPPLTRAQWNRQYRPHRRVTKRIQCQS